MSFFSQQRPNILATQNDVIIPRDLMEPPRAVPITTAPVPGEVNPISRVTTHKYMNVNTANRTMISNAASTAPALSTSSTNCLLTLPTPVRGVLSMSVKSIRLPSLPYTVTTKSNAFWVQDNNEQDNPRPCTAVLSSPTDCDGEGWNQYVIEPGNYTGEEICEALNHTGSGVGFYYVPTLCKIGIKCNDASLTIAFAGSFPVDEGLGWILGFRDRHYTLEKTDCDDAFALACKDTCQRDGLAPWVGMMDCTDGETKKVCLSMAEATYSPYNATYFMLCIDDYQTNVGELYVEEPGVSRTIDRIGARQNTMARVDIIREDPCATYGSFCRFRTEITPSKRNYFGPITLDKLRVMLIDSRGAQIDLNNDDFSLVLELKCMYRC